MTWIESRKTALLLNHVLTIIAVYVNVQITKKRKDSKKPVHKKYGEMDLLNKFA